MEVEHWTNKEKLQCYLENIYYLWYEQIHRELAPEIQGNHVKYVGVSTSR